MKKLRVRTVIISDVHLGTPDAKVREVNHFLRSVRCEKLILNGDIIDGWQLRRGGHWSKAETRFVRIALKKLEKRDTEIVYLRGNHDDILASFLPLDFENLRIVEDYVHEGVRGRYLVLHGDVFDTITKNFVFLAHLGDWGYRALLRLNRAYNAWRAWRGLEYWSLSRAIKARVKSAVSHISKFETQLAQLARERGCTGVMCGHIHTPADKMLGDIHYLNSGDWVESLTAVVEHWDGRYELIEFAKFLQDFPFEEEETEAVADEPETATAAVTAENTAPSDTTSPRRKAAFSTGPATSLKRATREQETLA
jgi:UDP-2,3-diacylglucosamine pyrophosphatase LpxH